MVQCFKDKLIKAPKPNPSFKNHDNYFENLLTTINIKTKFEIVSLIMTNDSKKAITVEKVSNNEYWVNMYDLNRNE